LKSVDWTVQRKRRSGRIAKEIAIVLLGTDTSGKMFSEETNTVVLSRHGAGVVSRYRFSPDELLTLRLPDSSKEAEIRFVGQIGGEPGRYVYGVAFVDPDPHFWPMEFPPPEPFESPSSFLLLECSLCQARQNVEQHEIEEDVYSVNGNVLRFCEDCGLTTPWRKSAGEAVLSPAVLSSSASLPQPNLNDPPAAPRRSSAKPALKVPAFAASFEPVQGASPAPASDEPPSPYSGTSTISGFAARSDGPVADTPVSFAVARATAVLEAAAAHGARPAAILGRELDANGRPVNQRRHVRIRVSFSACVRHPAHADEVVECENVSKGGFAFTVCGNTSWIL
jgi:hypothetical protein